MVDHLPGELENIKKKGKYIKEKLEKINTFKIVDIRGKGLMIGIELDEPFPELRERAFEKGLLLNMISSNTVIRLLPSLTISYEEIDEIIKKLEELL
ncbi:aminotransferase class III-fold pyridoxal phosphate-dependent enzyme [Marinitoga lauensis]|uniref:aminotransferase class III-fold pyridoxal phosphate-dependent enzyme n=1 Tax=Marinitoga lauensis TaxID=2201189 RepID=UPI0023EA5D00|nr:aminotransferase class III-fold pyridoxal phosphate-dependent enzyme [Marinitoga lauensis]